MTMCSEHKTNDCRLCALAATATTELLLLYSRSSEETSLRMPGCCSEARAAVYRDLTERLEFILQRTHQP